MRVPRIRPLGHRRHALLPDLGRGLDGLLEGVVKRDRVGERPRVSPGEAHVAQVVDGHSRADDDDALVAQRGDGLTQPVVRVRVLVLEQADLDERAVERVRLGVEGDVET